MKKLLVTGATNFNEDDIAEIRNLGFDCYYLQNENDDLPIPCSFFDAVICNNLFSFHQISLFSSLKIIQLTSSGTDRTPVDYIYSKGIKLFNARGVYSIPIAEFVVSGILDLLKKKSLFIENQRKHEWKKYRDLTELNGLKCLIVGCGSVGQECAKRLSAFGCEVEGIDNKNDRPQYFDNVYNTSLLIERIEKADVVIMTVPLNNDTYHLINKNVLDHFKSNAILVNVSRGKVVCEKDLLEYIDNIGGAVLDVFEEEPLDRTSALWNKNNIIITPHNSFVSIKNKDRLLDLVVKNLKAFS